MFSTESSVAILPAQACLQVGGGGEGRGGGTVK